MVDHVWPVSPRTWGSKSTADICSAFVFTQTAHRCVGPADCREKLRFLLHRWHFSESGFPRDPVNCLFPWRLGFPSAAPSEDTLLSWSASKKNTLTHFIQTEFMKYGFPLNNFLFSPTLTTSYLKVCNLPIEKRSHPHFVLRLVKLHLMVFCIAQTFGNWEKQEHSSTGTLNPTIMNSVWNVHIRICSLLFSTNVRTTVPESSSISHWSTSPPPFLLLEKWISSLFSIVSVSIFGRLEIKMRWGQTSESIWSRETGTAWSLKRS